MVRYFYSSPLSRVPHSHTTCSCHRDPELPEPSHRAVCCAPARCSVAWVGQTNIVCGPVQEKMGRTCEISWSIQSRVAATVAAVRFVVCFNGIRMAWRWCGRLGCGIDVGEQIISHVLRDERAASERPLFVFLLITNGIIIPHLNPT